MTDSEQVTALFAYTRSDASLKAGRWQLSPAKKARIAICATPKSGSTWATNVLGNALRVRPRRLCYTYSSNEHDLYVPALLDSQDDGLVSQLHMRATPHNVMLLKDFRIATVILTRNIFDAVMSFARDLRVKVGLKSPNPGYYGYSFVWLADDMRDWSEQQLVDYSIVHYLPWYLNFLRSWDAYRSALGAYPLRYEALRASPEEEFGSIYAHFYKGPEIDFSSVVNRKFGDRRAMSQTSSDTGAGYQQLSEQQIERITKGFYLTDSEWVRSHLSARP